MSLEENIVVLMGQAAPEDLHKAAKVFNKPRQVDTYCFSGDCRVEPMFLTEEQKQTLRERYGVSGIFSDGTGEPGDVDIYFTGEIELLDDTNMVISGFSFLTKNMSKPESDYEWGLIQPERSQLLDIVMPYAFGAKS